MKLFMRWRDAIDIDGFFNRRFIDINDLKPSCQSSVFSDKDLILCVLANTTQLTGLVRV